jgi:proteic killer suppression protein
MAPCVVTAVKMAKQAERDLTKCPSYIISKFKYWVGLVEVFGLHSAQKIKGFHDEPLKGSRVRQRSIRLNKNYRVIYTILRDGLLAFVLVLEVNKHEY